MSILDTPREYKKPTEEVARLIIAFACGLDNWDNEFWAEEREGCFDTAAAVLSRLNALGFISPLGQDALKAEAMAAKEGK